MERWWLVLLLTLVFRAGAPLAKPLARDEVPEPLKPWVDWVLLDHQDQRCPFLYHSDGERRCSWPTRLELNLKESEGHFTIGWRVYLESVLRLPGDKTHWPSEVTIDGNPAVVIEREGKPSVEAKPGNHVIAGRFLWDRIPENLIVPADTGLIRLTVKGTLVNFPKLDGDRLWLRESDTGRRERAEITNTLELQVFRRVIDEIPLQQVTRLVLDVAGEAREALLGPILLPDFIPLAVESPLPARLEPDGRLLLQVRPGRWQIDLSARQPAEITSLTLPVSPKPWPETEVWVFDARNALRLVEVTGVPAVDPQQVNLPPEWRQLPAFRLKGGDAMGFKVIRRGDPDPEPNRLTLQRTLWLDFDGGGMTVHDAITGTMTQGWRLRVDPQMRLGRAALDGRDQLVTRMPGTEEMGVEVRRGAVDLRADSRIETAITSLSAVGWKEDFHRVSAVLNLPPGWRLFSVTGVDNVPDTWIYRWTLLDLFMVTIASLAFGKLWRWRWGLFALFTFALIWHEAGAPHYVWLHLLASVALLRVLPSGRFAAFVKLYRNLSLFALAVIAIPFMIDQVRNGLYPQLERPWQQIAGYPSREEGREAMDRGRSTAPMLKEEARIVSPMPLQKTEEAGVAVGEAKPDAISSLLDPQSMVQTGPGLPQWQWRQVSLSWNGPVAQEQRVGLIFLPPTVVMMSKFLSVILILALSVLMFTGKADALRGLVPALRSLTAWLLLVPLLSAPGDDAYAAFPEPKLLEELKNRLLSPPQCLPACAQIPLMRMKITPSALQLQLEIHAAEQVALPLPSRAGQWEPSQVTVDKTPASALYKGPAGDLWLDLTPGKHQIVLEGLLPGRSHLSLPLPLTPRRVEVEAEGWEVAGIGENGVPEAQLQLSRMVGEKPGRDERPEQDLEFGSPPFARVERTLLFGLDWSVRTRIVRSSPPGAAVVLQVPLLAGESVTTAGLRVEKDRVLVNMLPGERMIVWESMLEKRPQIVLTAQKTNEWVEVWRADVSPIWRLESEGIAVVHHGGKEGRWLPEWRPWPGESVKLNITRPQGLEDRTLTVDDSRLKLKPGKRSTDATLELTIRSSQGGQHTVVLPDSARLNSVMIDGEAQPVRQSGQQVTLPIRPGRQGIALNWRESLSLASWFRGGKIDLATESVNSSINLTLEQDRWVLFAGGPDFGPAVLFWGILIVIAFLALGLGYVPFTPLRSWQWFLLLVGLSQIPAAASLVVVGWLIALGLRGRSSLNHLGPVRFNLLQAGLGLLTVVALILLFAAIKQGLLGTPDMQISGNQSTPYSLNWYQDLSRSELPQPWIVSVPLIAYQLLMLVWSLWLAYALLGWLGWGWGCYSSGGFWRRGEREIAKG